MTPAGFRVRHLAPHEPVADALAEILIDCVAGGASVGFLWPLSHERALAFWNAALAGVARGERVILVAQDTTTGRLIGTVQLVLALQQNQPHRADVAKMLVHRDWRRRGVAVALMQDLEKAALAASRTLLVLDTVSRSPASQLYTKLGWQRCGEIPDYALWPDGSRCDTTYYYKPLA